jgi:hypothetical protein
MDVLVCVIVVDVGVVLVVVVLLKQNLDNSIVAFFFFSRCCVALYILPGLFVVSTANVPFTESGVGVVVMIATLDGNGASSDDRKFSFYCTRLYASCTSVRAQKKKFLFFKQFRSL